MNKIAGFASGKVQFLIALVYALCFISSIIFGNLSIVLFVVILSFPLAMIADAVGANLALLLLLFLTDSLFYYFLFPGELVQAVIFSVVGVLVAFIISQSDTHRFSSAYLLSALSSALLIALLQIAGLAIAPIDLITIIEVSILVLVIDAIPALIIFASKLTIANYPNPQRFRAMILPFFLTNAIVLLTLTPAFRLSFQALVNFNFNQGFTVGNILLGWIIFLAISYPSLGVVSKVALAKRPLRNLVRRGYAHTRITLLDLVPNPATVGEVVMLTGILTRDDAIDCAGTKVSVYIEHNSYTAWTSNGGYFVTSLGSFANPGTVSVEARFVGCKDKRGVTLLTSYGQISLTIQAAAVKTKITLEVSENPAKIGSGIQAYGILSRDDLGRVDGEHVIVTMDGVPYTTVVSSKGEFSVMLPSPKTLSSLHLRASFSGGKDAKGTLLANCESTVVDLRVVPNIVGQEVVSEKSGQKIAEWPRISEYKVSFENIQKLALDDDLRKSTVLKNKRGTPCSWAGKFAVVFKVSIDGDLFAMKCFTHDYSVRDLPTRYAILAEYLDYANLPLFYKCEFVNKGIRVESDRLPKEARSFPVLKMEWAKGERLHEFLGKNYRKQRLLQDLAKNFIDSIDLMHRMKIAHGDLSSLNIFVKEEGTQPEVSLVDYDGMYIPNLNADPPSEIGIASFQHPKRKSTNDYGPDMDNFASLNIYTSLLAIAENPSLWEKYGRSEERIIFKESDFEKPEESTLLRELKGRGYSEQVNSLAELLEEALGMKPDWDRIYPSEVKRF